MFGILRKRTPALFGAALRSSLVAACLVLIAGSANAGTVRYDLTGLLGQHVYDGAALLLPAYVHIDTPFGFYSAESARLVIAGTVTAGKAHGDGNLREATEFVIEPLVSARPSFQRVFNLQVDPTPAAFRFDNSFSYPFVPETTPLPNPDGYPPMSFNVMLEVSPGFTTQFPPALDPKTETLYATDGVIVDTPIVANITEAYIIFDGSGIVPEPAGWQLALIGTLALSFFGRNIRARRVPRVTLRRCRYTRCGCYDRRCKRCNG